MGSHRFGSVGALSNPDFLPLEPAIFQLFQKAIPIWRLLRLTLLLETFLPEPP